MMDQVILSMLDKYQCDSDQDYENALKQIIQQVALLGLWRAKFFEHAAFYGGTALRILYGLDRFSEDLDFSLLYKDQDFQLKSYLNAIQQELSAFGFDTEVAIKEKNIDTEIQSAFLKANTQQHLIRIDAPEVIQRRCHSHKLLKIKLEIDTEPPSGFSVETKPLFQPVPFWVKSYSLPDLFAGKVSALLCRTWETRIKGRDWYDFLWFIQQEIPLNLNHLETRLRDFGFYSMQEQLSREALADMLIEKFQSLNVQLAKKDIAKFIKDPSRLDAWSNDLFIAAVGEIK